ncbi:DUF1905 domain-containing protein [Candidatus Nomurabacteria bacterium]|nr:DUF1905 domain-containing protein [Candidatus Nomurabacteria bacterium]
MKKNFKIEAKVWRWPGDGGWYFVTLPKKLWTDIRKKYQKGFVRVVAKVGKTSWDTSLFPHKQSENYLISVKKSVRQKEDIWEGDTVKINFTIK